MFYNSIFIDMDSRASCKLAYFPAKDLSSTPGYLASYLYVLPSSDRSRMRSCPERSIQTFVFCPYLLPSATKSCIPAALLCTAGNCFRPYPGPYLSIPACAIEVQHDKENCSTVSWNICQGFVCLIPLQFNLSCHEFHASFRSTQRLFSVKYLFGEGDIA